MAQLLTRSASLTGYGDLARAFGLDPRRLCAEVGLPAACLTDPDLKIPALAVGRLLERAARRSGAEDFGLRLAETRQLSNLGAVAFVLREQPTLAKAIEALVSYTWAQNQALTLRLDIAGDVAVLRQTASGPGRSRQSVELSLGVIARAIRQLVGPGSGPREARFMHGRPADVATHRRVFGDPLWFDQDFDGLVFEAADLEAPISGADPVAARRALRYVEWEAGAGRRDTAATVRELILALLPTGTCGIARVAALMGVSRRTLHRRLAEDGGQSFEALLDEIRTDLARRYIADGRHSLTEVASRLGYGSLSAFSRWRRRRLGGGRRKDRQLFAQ
ncbi:MAG: AraC family transcriptional regulator [Phenylobacterium sp.]|uniref:AraC family transcriptional regulator n=1 Tax=Phenylobacterium sp. TaxID=1871053 RepID=UPI001A41DB19|nr:AraC family transcriptional regulator [Phenylobacterium sp.]MBL8554555.1 AraC family transcriptional regulator [Phenylobacterium sp.]